VILRRLNSSRDSLGWEMGHGPRSGVELHSSCRMIKSEEEKDVLRASERESRGCMSLQKKFSCRRYGSAHPFLLAAHTLSQVAGAVMPAVGV
jgi:hypothetical protein